MIRFGSSNSRPASRAKKCARRPSRATWNDAPPLMTAVTHLQRLEAESIHIFREVVAECERPVMLYSIGKDSSVMLHLALKAFAPGKPPFPLLQIASGWDFRQMLEFRDATAKQHGLTLLVHTNEAGARAGIRPWSHGAT